MRTLKDIETGLAEVISKGWQNAIVQKISSKELAILTLKESFVNVKDLREVLEEIIQEIDKKIEWCAYRHAENLKLEKRLRMKKPEGEEDDLPWNFYSAEALMALKSFLRYFLSGKSQK